MFRKFKEAQAARLETRNRLADEWLTEALAMETRRAHDAWDAARLDDGEAHVRGVALASGEVAHLVINSVGLVEPRSDPGTWVGASHGVSFKVAKGVRYRVGQTRRTFQQGKEPSQIIDTGIGVVANRRIVFVGSKRTTEWAFTKLVGFSLDQDCMAIFKVSNRQNALGFAYQPDVDHIVDAVVTAAIAQHQSPEDHATVVADLLALFTDAYASWKAFEAQCALE